ncbi:uncharacterized protein PHACADRAFT_202092 [Phanerochaete carnosa HHB-10118-sp]|uniref:Uncharacterized protein n=1 Tax=Phanerochaete carnosa (strain HHB-10118-sp) TaxID=650164 RepID=K5WFR4_PHACS|nr:uncharacterized protein PHACADRAFT_202092 [Phanerochaete carnosa HHB-10118-sp]EKM49037.1 hypothetical protein PHACADRAFT_202092 [Phanerochaete carnosa HHB-10118-sp]
MAKLQLGEPTLFDVQFVQTFTDVPLDQTEQDELEGMRNNYHNLMLHADALNHTRYEEIIKDLPEPAPPLELYKFPNNKYYDDGKSDHIFCAITETFGYCSSMKAMSTAQEHLAARGKTMRVYFKINNLEAAQAFPVVKPYHPATGLFGFTVKG